MPLSKKFFFAVVLSLSFGLSAIAKKSRFTPLPGFWHVDQELKSAFGGRDKCTIVFDQIPRQSGLDPEFFETFADELLSKGKKANVIVSCDDSFFSKDTKDITFSGRSTFYDYKVNGSTKYISDVRGSSGIPSLNLEIDPESSMEMTGLVQTRIQSGGVNTINFTATRRAFIPGSRVLLKNSIRPVEKLKTLNPGDTVTFVAQVKSLGPTTLAQAEAELYISLNDEISVSDITVLESSEDGSENISSCFGQIDSSISAQIQCTLKGLDQNNDRSKLIFKVKIPESLEGKKLQIAVFSVVDDEVLKVLSRAASYEQKVKTEVVQDSRAKVSCVVKGTSPVKKVTNFVETTDPNKGSAFFSRFNLNESSDNKGFILDVNQRAGKSNVTITLSGQFDGNPSLASLATGETVSFQVGSTRLNVGKGPSSLKQKNVQNVLSLGGNEGTGPFQGAVKMTAADDKTVSGLITVKMTGATLTKTVSGLEKSSKVIPETTVTCKFRGLRTQ